VATFHDPFLRQPNGYYSTPGPWMVQRIDPQKKAMFGTPIRLGGGRKRYEALGFGGNLRCPKCGGIFDFLLIEFKEALPFRIQTHDELKQQFEEDIMKCPNCGHGEMELEAA